ncbi:MAG: aminodeoxychorismate/anthranilate synthase component II [Planctomycetia bacterium]|nr:aminodeoxychorismate/anthranilate synthase component II [Planctomycetia bacterium]
MKTVILDNYDSFTYNLYQYVGELDEAPLVFRNDKISLAELRALEPDRIVISPGPGSPDDPAYFGVCREAILEFGPTTPILGVCLGHQGIVHAFGGQIVRAREVMHGKTSYITHDERGLFAGLPRRFEVMRYHSLIVDPATLPACLRVTAKTADGVIMAVEHREHQIFGVQFHPESIGTTVGKQLLENFLRGSPNRVQPEVGAT